jgi:hypothetical protein
MIITVLLKREKRWSESVLEQDTERKRAQLEDVVHAERNEEENDVIGHVCFVEKSQHRRIVEKGGKGTTYRTIPELVEDT